MWRKQVRILYDNNHDNNNSNCHFGNFKLDYIDYLSTEMIISVASRHCLIIKLRFLATLIFVPSKQRAEMYLTSHHMLGTV